MRILLTIVWRNFLSFSRKIDLVFSLLIYGQIVLMASNSSITKQVLINNLGFAFGLNRDLTDIIKEYVFYDHLGQLIKLRRDVLFREINNIRIGLTEGITILQCHPQFVHKRIRTWSHVRIWRRHPRPFMEYIMCSICGNFYQTRERLPLRMRLQYIEPTESLSRITCVCSFRFTLEQQYSSIRINPAYRYDSDFDEDFSSSSESDSYINNSDDESDNNSV